MYSSLFWDVGRFGHHGFGYGMYSGGGMWIMGLFVLAVIAALTLSIIAIVRTSKKRNATGDALRIVDERYAKGELTKEEYDVMKKDLR
ncbi:SHOCT domain-containing protein [Sphaerochaeta sp. S2]|uniref:SHOCT domain-containing protein n=1 Tax=Sphaerochaeta sp. S2 TaxID=2798868 RepID=UPI0018EA1329|nr:SHOCT domain-containing protein [Sphaerochaeta sp. S2]MBJ2357612.1 SHOCT domain-containing protein [Sphaerochaeta sp. S2]